MSIDHSGVDTAGRQVAARLLYCGEISPGSTSEMRMRALGELGFVVTAVPLWPMAPTRHVQRLMALSFKFRHPIDFTRANARIRALGASSDFVWIDKGITIWRRTLRSLRRNNPRVRIIGYSPDNMAERPFNSAYFLRSLPEYDAFITTKSYGVAELGALGSPRTVFCENAFDPVTHHPFHELPERASSPMIDVGFVGTYERDRADAILEACSQGVTVDVFGNGWDALRPPIPRNLRLHPSVNGPIYASTLSRCRIALCFLRRLSRDLQTTRSVEIPACGAFMLAERTEEHLGLFTEGEEAAYFSSTREMIAKIRFYLADDHARARVARAGYMKTRVGRYSYAWRLFEALRAAGLPTPREPAALECDSPCRAPLAWPAMSDG
jgi:spore maturation protein CgeB